MTNRIKQTLKLSAIGACIGLVSPASMAGTEALTAQECSLIQGYNAIEGNDFIDHFAKMAHQVEFCQKTNGACELPLKKRVEDYYLILNQPKSFETEALASAARQELNTVLTDLYATTGLKYILDKPNGTDKYIFVVFVEPEIVELDYEAYLKAYITRTTFPNPAWRKEMFDYFLESSQPCMGLVSISEDHLLEIGHIWMRSDLDEVTTRKCVSEEFYNLFGLDEGDEVTSIFDYTFARESDEASLSDFDLLKLRLLYMNDFKPGFSKKQTRKTVRRILKNQCNIEN